MEPVESLEPDVQIGIKDEKGEVGLRVTLELFDKRFMIRIDCAAFFRKLEPKKKYERIGIGEFIRDEALPLLIPYIRETLADISRRVNGKPLNLGLIRTDDLSPVDGP